jgi:hypothetical protein
MAIPEETARQILLRFDAPQMRNLFAQAQARHVLFEVREDTANFPAFDPALDDKVSVAAHSVLAAAASLIETARASSLNDPERMAVGINGLERAASLLHYVHGPSAPSSRESGFHELVAAMAFYAAGHYSRAFVTMRNVREQTDAARAIAAFLRKDIPGLVHAINSTTLLDHADFSEQGELDEWAITVTVARAVALALEFICVGDFELLRQALAELEDATVIVTEGGHPGWWSVVRLLRLMLGDLGDASPWRVLPPYFPPGNQNELRRYIQLLAFARYPITEFWTSQRQALPLALDQNNRGAVINLRTSAGKTRVAELAILQTLLSDNDARVFYLAPFRSLALEIERSLNDTFNWLGYGVSHLYGGSRVSSVDTELAAEAAITIVTPEKARALLRAAPDLLAKIKLFIIDEGHLLGPFERYVRNEIFVDHLRSAARTTGARILLLSAVLPNAQDLAEWIAADSQAVAISPWKPSAERFGILRWNGSRVRVDWLGEVPSFNPSFIVARPLGFGRRRKYFPCDKNEAVAAAAVRLSEIGPVMIFSGKATSIPSLAKAVLLALGEESPDYSWPGREWKIFVAVCSEELDDSAIEVRAARAGVLCHSNRLTPQVRLAMEHLMRAGPPKIVIATTTLAQGVNVGISSVIIASPYTGQYPIDKRDFWNIAGRAGRAFVDGEGKILYAIDQSQTDYQVRNQEALARQYFESSTADRVESGLLYLLKRLRQIATRAGVAFEVLLELAANNDFSRLGHRAGACEDLCDLLDDELLALQLDDLVNPSGGEPESWIDDVFRQSLAAIQARTSGSEVDARDVVQFLRARAKSALVRLPDVAGRRAVMSSGLPLRVGIEAQAALGVFSRVADSIAANPERLSVLTSAVREIEDWARQHAAPIVGNPPEASRLEALREGWLSGQSLRGLCDVDKEAASICKDFWGYQLTWIIHAAAQQVRVAADEDRAKPLARLALLLELGVPNELAARIFLAGIRSRVASTELASLSIASPDASVFEIARVLRDPGFLDERRPYVSPTTVDWLELIVSDFREYRRPKAPDFEPFSLPNADGLGVVHLRQLEDGGLRLCSVDGRVRLPVESTDRQPFRLVANDPRFAFARSGPDWQLVIRDPRLARA